MIRDSWQDFKYSWLNSLLSWTFLQQDKNIKIIVIMNGSVTFEIYKSYFNTFNTELCWLCSFFLNWFFPHYPYLSQLILKKSYSQISEKHNQIINLTYAFYHFICFIIWLYRLIFELRWVWWNQMAASLY